MKKIVLAILIAVVVAVVGLAGWAYIQNKDAREAGKFIKGTVINGVDCGNLNVQQASEKLTEAWNDKNYVIKKDNKEIASLSDFNFEYDIEQNLKDCVSSEPIKAIFTYYGLSKNEKEIKMPVKKQTKNFIKQVRKVKLPVTGKKVATRSAYIDMSTREFNIVPEVYGNTISKIQLRKKIVSDIENGNFEMDYDAKSFYTKPKVCKDNNKLLKRQKYCRKYLSAKVVWDLTYARIELTPEQMDSMIKVDDGSIVVDENAVMNYVNDMAYTAEAGYNSYKGTSGKSLSVSKSVNGLIDALASGKDAKVKAVFTGGTVGPVDKKSTYVEIDISSQTLWLYSKGKTIVETPIVTGDVSHHSDTPTGTFHIYYKQSPATLRGRDYDGSKYASKVDYWMPFNGDIGLHDAPWKSVFGGNEYLYRGSHGCVNLPHDAAEKIYSRVEAGTKVVVHQ